MDIRKMLYIYSNLQMTNLLKYDNKNIKTGFNLPLSLLLTGISISSFIFYTVWKADLKWKNQFYHDLKLGINLLIGIKILFNFKYSVFSWDNLADFSQEGLYFLWIIFNFFDTYYFQTASESNKRYKLRKKINL